MGRFIKRLLTAVCCICIIFSSTIYVSAIPAKAYSVLWHSLEEFVDVVPKEKYVVIKVKVKDKTEKLYLSFPSF